MSPSPPIPSQLRSLGLAVVVASALVAPAGPVHGQTGFLWPEPLLPCDATQDEVNGRPACSAVQCDPSSDPDCASILHWTTFDVTDPNVEVQVLYKDTPFNGCALNDPNEFHEKQLGSGLQVDQIRNFELWLVDDCSVAAGLQIGSVFLGKGSVVPSAIGEIDVTSANPCTPDGSGECDVDLSWRSWHVFYYGANAEHDVQIQMDGQVLATLSPSESTQAYEVGPVTVDPNRRFQLFEVSTVEDEEANPITRIELASVVLRSDEPQGELTVNDATGNPCLVASGQTTCNHELAWNSYSIPGGKTIVVAVLSTGTYYAFRCGASDPAEMTGPGLAVTPGSRKQMALLMVDGGCPGTSPITSYTILDALELTAAPTGSIICPFDRKVLADQPWVDDDFVGIEINELRGDLINNEAALEEIAEGLAAAGVYYVRLSIRWNALGVNPDQSDWDRVYGALLDIFTDAGLELWVTLKGTPTGEEQSPCSGIECPPDVEAWEEFVQQAVDHLEQYGVMNWELWQEPDIDQFFTGTVEQYIELLEATRDILKTNDPDYVLWAPNTVFGSRRAEDRIWDWIKPVLNATDGGGDPLFDGLAIHVPHRGRSRAGGALGRFRPPAPDRPGAGQRGHLRGDARGGDLGLLHGRPVAADRLPVAAAQRGGAQEVHHRRLRVPGHRRRRARLLVQDLRPAAGRLRPGPRERIALDARRPRPLYQDRPQRSSGSARPL